jgi:lipoate-protein ligase A
VRSASSSSQSSSIVRNSRDEQVGVGVHPPDGADSELQFGHVVRVQQFPVVDGKRENSDLGRGSSSPAVLRASVCFSPVRAMTVLVPNRERLRRLPGGVATDLRRPAVARSMTDGERGDGGGGERRDDGSGSLHAPEALREREWRLITEESRPGPIQMALDEVAAETAADGGPRTLRVYRWQPSCLSMGYRQPPDTVDWVFCEREGIDVTRRQTGGGGIYHDAVGDVSYSIVAPKGELPGRLMDCYRLLLDPVLDAFSRLGVDAEFVPEEREALHSPACYLRALHPAHDLVVDGRKVAGNAQYRRKDAVVQHGSISHAVRAEPHLGVFADPGVSPDRFRERVAGIEEHADVSRAETVAAVEDALADWAGASVGSWTSAELDRAEALAAETSASDVWVRRTPDAR